MKIRNSLWILMSFVLFAGCNPSTEVFRNPDNTVESGQEQAIADEVRITNNAAFNVDVENGTITVEISYVNSGNLGAAFLLNRDFTVTELICDGEEIDPEEIKELILFDEEYPVNRYSLPHFEDSLHVAYTGYLSGETSSTGYARETISTAYTLLRSETYCYPLFAEDWESLLAFLNDPIEMEIAVNVPAQYIAATPYALISKEEIGNHISYRFAGDMASFNCAVAKFNTLQLSSGEYYFMPDADAEEMAAFVTPIMAQTQQFMSERFGEANIPSSMQYIVIPNTFGSYAIPGRAVFIEEGAFVSVFEMRQLIHEYIHLGWNAKTEMHVVQRSRFFDEAFTSYFEARVLGHLIDEATYQSRIESCKQSVISMLAEDKEKLVPVIDYGKYEYGDLSYRVGPIFFEELSQLVGIDTFDAATKAFLEKYRDTPVDFDTMCGEYMELCDTPDLESFFQDWLYSTRGIERILEEG